MAKKEKLTKVFLKQKRPHKTGFRLGKHLVKMGVAQEFELSEKEVKELESEGPKAWLKVVTQKEMDAAPKSNKENKELQDLKKSLNGRIELKGDESIEELKDLRDEVDMFDALVESCKEKGLEVLDEDTVESLEEKLAE